MGMRICFVPDDEIEKEPEIDVREPDNDTEYSIETQNERGYRSSDT